MLSRSLPPSDYPRIPHFCALVPRSNRNLESPGPQASRLLQPISPALQQPSNPALPRHRACDLSMQQIGSSKTLAYLRYSDPTPAHSCVPIAFTSTLKLVRFRATSQAYNRNTPAPAPYHPLLRFNDFALPRSHAVLLRSLTYATTRYRATTLSHPRSHPRPVYCAFGFPRYCASPLR